MHTPDVGPEAAETRELLRRAQRGERGALDALVGRYLPRLRRWASGRLPPACRDVSATTDLVHDVFVQVLGRIDTLRADRDGGLAAYLRQAVLNRVRDELRRARRHPHRLALDETLDVLHAPPLDVVAHESLARYERALARLRPTDREVLVARLELGCTFEEVAQLTARASANAARMAVNRALVQLLRGMRHG